MNTSIPTQTLPPKEDNNTKKAAVDEEEKKDEKPILQTSRDPTVSVAPKSAPTNMMAAVPPPSSFDQMLELVQSNGEPVWFLLATRMNLPRERAIHNVARASMEMATGLTGAAALRAHLTPTQLAQFREDYFVVGGGDEYFFLGGQPADPTSSKGNKSKEVFRRAIFATFDTDNLGILGEGALEQWLELTYSMSPNMRGGIRLPPKQQLEKVVVARMDEKEIQQGERRLTFEEMNETVWNEIQQLDAAAAALDASFENHTSVRNSSSGLRRLLPEEDDDDDDHACDFCAWLERLLSPPQPLKEVCAKIRNSRHGNSRHGGEVHMV